MDPSTDTDTGDTTTGQSTIGNIPPRISLVNTAATFLQNPNVARSSIAQREQFLRKKGLSNEEVQMAFQRAGVFTKDPNNAVINMEIGQQPMPPALYRSPPESAMQKIYHIISSTALVAGVVYAIYHVYKRYIEPLLFGRKKDKKSTAEAIEGLETKIEKNIRELSVELKAVKDEFRTAYDNEHVLRRDLSSFKNDLDAIKGLLLNRKQFTSPVVPPSIPAWQLQSQRSIGVGDNSANPDGDKNDDNGSADGSGGSSETEVVTKHSDSSLELIS